jgi:tRNA G10  N-methylase Trm11
MARAGKKEEKIITKNYKTVMIESLMKNGAATDMELTETIKEEIPFLKFESPYKVKAEYVLPTLEKSKCFVSKGKNSWELSKVFLNLENYAYTILKKNKYPLTYEQLREYIAQENGLHPTDIPLKLEEDERFVLVEVGGEEYYFIDEWEFCNQYAFAVFAENKNAPLSVDEITEILASRYKRKKKSMIIMLEEDGRFKMNLEEKYSLYPKYLKRFKRADVPKSVLDEIFKRFESGSRSISMLELAEEFFELPLPLTKLLESIEEDLRFAVSGDKVKRSKLSLDDIREIKRKARAQKKAEKQELEEEELAEEVPVTEEYSAAEPEIDMDEEEEDNRLNEALEDLRRKIVVGEGDEDMIEDAPADIGGLLKKKVPVIKKSTAASAESFELETCGVDIQELEEYLQNLTDSSGLLQGMNPDKFDEILRQYLPMKVRDYRSTNPYVSDFMVQLAKPRLEHIVLDPVCGRGDLLLKVLQYVKGSLRKEHEQDAEMFETFCDEQVVAFDLSDTVLQGASLNLSMSGFDVPLLEAGNSLEDQEMLMEDMVSMVFGDFTNFNSHEMKQFFNKFHRVLQDEGIAVVAMNHNLLSEDEELAQIAGQKYNWIYRFAFHDYDGIEKDIIYLKKREETETVTQPKTFELDSYEQFDRLLSLLF